MERTTGKFSTLFLCLKNKYIPACVEKKQAKQSLHLMSRNDNYDENDEEYEDDPYSPTSWDRHADETDEEYQDRMEDQGSLLDYYS